MTVGPKESVLVTGASGFIGRHLIEVLKDQYTIYALARRTQKEVGIASHANLHWILVDITAENELTRAFAEITRAHPTIDYAFHLAAYYDFGAQQYNSIYEQTNVVATRRILELCRPCQLKRFIFASSIVASEFPAPGEVIFEKSPLNAVFPYALTKQKGEELTRVYSAFFPCTVVRLAAVFSDWCEYEPLYNSLNTWLKGGWDCRLFAGRQGVSIPYIHVSVVAGALREIILRTGALKSFDVFLLSSDKPTSLLELFERSTRLFLGRQLAPVYLPIWVVRVGVVLKTMLGLLRRKPPFERMWMTRYIDKVFPTDSSYSRQVLGYETKDRFRIEHRVLYMMENLKSVPEEWHRKNQSRLVRFRVQRPILDLIQVMHSQRDNLATEIYSFLTAAENQGEFSYYQHLEPERLHYFIDRFYRNLFTSVRHGDKLVMIGFARDLARVRFSEGLDRRELCGALKASSHIITRRLSEVSRLESMKQLVHDHIALAIQLAIDEIEDTYELLERKVSAGGLNPQP